MTSNSLSNTLEGKQATMPDDHFDDIQSSSSIQQEEGNYLKSISDICANSALYIVVADNDTDGTDMYDDGYNSEINTSSFDYDNEQQELREKELYNACKSSSYHTKY
jgi:hypothetical protein